MSGALTPAAMRALRGAAGWSMRECATAADVALATVLATEKGAEVSPRTVAKVRAAFRAEGVTITRRDNAVCIRIAGARPHARRTVGPACLVGLPYVVARPRPDGTHRVFFEVPAKMRPEGWPPTRPLPLTMTRRGDLSDPAEIEAIKTDAATLLGRLTRARTCPAPQDRR